MLCGDYRVCVEELIFGSAVSLFAFISWSINHTQSVYVFYCVAFYCSGLWRPAEPHQVTSEVKAALFCCAMTQKQGSQAQEQILTQTQSSVVYACSASFESSCCGIRAWIAYGHCMCTVSWVKCSSGSAVAWHKAKWLFPLDGHCTVSPVKKLIQWFQLILDRHTLYSYTWECPAFSRLLYNNIPCFTYKRVVFHLNN